MCFHKPSGEKDGSPYRMVIQIRTIGDSRREGKVRLASSAGVIPDLNPVYLGLCVSHESCNRPICHIL